MEKEEKIIYVNKEGYESHLEAIEALREKRNNINFSNNQFEPGSSDSWYSTANEDENVHARFLSDQIRVLEEETKRMVIVDSIKDENTIDIGDVVVIDMHYVDEIEELTIKLVSTFTEGKKEFKEVSVKSPLGNTIYKKKVLDKVSYKVSGEEVKVLIKDKLDLTKKKDKVKKLTK